MDIAVDDLTSLDVQELLRGHVSDMYAHCPPGSVHALDLDDLRRPEITLWTVRERGELLGCGALKELNSEHGEIKSMRTHAAHLRKGVARRLLKHILDEARRRGYRRVSLETGAGEHFRPARSLYESSQFIYCKPFEGYVDDPFSVFMTRELR